MAGIAAIAREAGIEVSGSDKGVYPPMSTLLDELGIPICEGYRAEDIPTGRTIVIGNAMSRGNPAVEHVLDKGLPYVSGPEWLRTRVLQHRNVLAVAGTHGKTSTASMLAWILHRAGESGSPGFLIGGKPGNFEHSAQLGEASSFVIEADEYDTAFFDKRSKFIHYRPRIAVLNNLEFDHADIFPDLEAIKTQFHHLVRTIPGNGRLIVNADDPNLPDVLNRGCWTPVESFSIRDQTADWYARALNPTADRFELVHDQAITEIRWSGIGEHNMSNALAAVAAACQTGISPDAAGAALAEFKFPARRLQLHPTRRGFRLYEDFAHHPTAIMHTLKTLRQAHPDRRLVALLELRSNTMQMGVHRTTLAPALAAADIVCVVNAAAAEWSLADADHPSLQEFRATHDCLAHIVPQIQAGDIVLVMSNGSFDAIVEQLSRI